MKANIEYIPTLGQIAMTYQGKISMHKLLYLTAQSFHATIGIKRMITLTVETGDIKLSKITYQGKISMHKLLYPPAQPFRATIGIKRMITTLTVETGDIKL